MCFIILADYQTNNILILPTAMDIQFSIIVPTYNRASLINNTLQSLLYQTYTNYEILVIDDGGTDNTKAVVDSINDSRISYHWKPNAERGAARNFGAALANGKYLNFFDSDDIAYSNHLEVASSFISQNPDIVAFHLSYDWKYPNMEIQRPSVVNVGEINAKIKRRNVLSCNSVFVRKDVFDVLKFSEDRSLSGTEDWLLWLRLACRYSIIGLPTITSAIIEHNSRSMNIASGDNTLSRTIAFGENMKQDTFISQTVYKSAMAEMYFLSALYFTIEGKKKEGIALTFKAVRFAPGIIYNRRMLAIIKYLLKK